MKMVGGWGGGGGVILESAVGQSVRQAVGLLGEIMCLKLLKQFSSIPCYT